MCIYIREINSTVASQDIEMNTQLEQKLFDFYKKWMGQLENLLHLLLLVSKGGCKELGYEDVVNKVMAHHKGFYTFKWAATHDDVLAVYSSVWLSPLANAYQWFNGWKPSTVFRLMESMKEAKAPRPPPIGRSLASMMEDQVKKIKALWVQIKVEEKKVEREMERLQVWMADEKMVTMAKMERQVKKEGGSVQAAQVEGLVEAAVKGLLVGLERVMKMVDCTRLRTLEGVLDVLTPVQPVYCLAANAMVQIQMRKMGENRR